MGECMEKVVLLLDNYGVDSQNLHASFRQVYKDSSVVVINDDGFLPEDVISVYDYFLGDFKNSDSVPGKPRYFNQIVVPAYWEISGNNSNGKVHDLGKERGRIFYAEPKHKRLVKVVDWYDESGNVRSSDHYNRYGALYARTIFNAKSKKVNRSYFSALGKEIIVENYVTGDIILNENSNVRIFHNKTDLVLYFMKKTGFEKYRVFFNSLSVPFFVSQRMSGNQKEDVLFWQEPVGDEIPGNMQIILSGKATRATKIMVQKRMAYRRLMELGASQEMVKQLGFIYPFKKDNGGKAEALICTNSDNIEQCIKLVEELPEVHFHIAALTEMSSKLMSMEKYQNVSLYPGVKAKTLDELWRKCDFYMDINHEMEIVSAVQNAFLHNQLIFAFENTIHNRQYIADEHIYSVNEINKMISDIRAILLDSQLLQGQLEIQKEWAMTENLESYIEV